MKSLAENERSRTIRTEDSMVKLLRALSLPLLPTLALAGVLAVIPRDASADIFTYVDKDGVLHFTNTPSKADPWKLYAHSKEGSKTATGTWTPRAFGGGGVDRYTRYDEYIREAAGYYQLPEAFVRAIIKVESDYDPTALSIAGAQGLMQLMPETGARMLVTDPWDPRENIFGGCRYLRVLANTFNGDLDLTIAAYNAGEGSVIRAGGIPSIPETQDYVVKVKSWYRRYRATPDAMNASVGSMGEAP
ncbi:MAG: transglycosylase SLT domain-containing protein [Polyangiales bacterium]